MKDHSGKKLVALTLVAKGIWNSFNDLIGIFLLKDNWT